MGRVMPNLGPRISLVAAVLIATLAPAQSGAQGAQEIPRSFRWYYSHSPAGWRYWTRTDIGWVERYPDGRENHFESLGMTWLTGSCSAVRARKLHGPTNEPPTEVAIPTRGCGGQVLVFRFLGPNGPTSDWKKVGDLEAIEY